jgi:hypothetical protein
MSTRWQIAAKLGDGRCACIYVHCDGYPDYALALLTAHYRDQQRIDKLIALGDCLSIDAALEKCDRFGEREDWEDVQPSYDDDLLAVAEKHRHGDEQYRYTWDGSRWEMSRL